MITALLLQVLCEFASPAPARAGPASEIPDSERIHSIRFIRLPVFPETTGTPLPWYFRLANRLHRETREWVIRREILYKEGSPYDPLRVRESERLLRNRGFFESARINPARGDSGYETTIHTQDLWTLGINVDMQKEANISSVTLGFSESNLLGTGNGVHLSHTISSDRNSSLASFTVPRIGWTRASLSGAYSQSGRLSTRLLAVSHPIESYFDRWSWDVAAYDMRGEQRFFTDGEESGVSRFVREHYVATLGRYNGLRHKAGYGAGLIRERSVPRGAPRSLLGGIPPPPAVERIDFAGPLIFGGFIDRRFVPGRNIERYGALEDVPLGWSASVAIASNARRSRDPDRAVAVRPQIDVSVPIGGTDLVAAGEVLGVAYHGPRSAPRERIIQGVLGLRWQPTPMSLTFAQLAFHGAIDQPRASIFYIGGGSGLRGYPARKFAARDYLLASLEQRVWSGIEVAWLGFGADAFVDAARPTMDGRFDREPWRAGIGFGLLFGWRKSTQPPIRLELAWPTDGADRRPTLSLTTNTVLQLLPSVELPGGYRDLHAALR